jgi:hypothetical protein
VPSHEANQVLAVIVVDVRITLKGGKLSIVIVRATLRLNTSLRMVDAYDAIKLLMNMKINGSVNHATSVN